MIRGIDAELPGCFAPDYLTARNLFRDAAGDVGARISGHRIAARGPGDEDLWIDTAVLGPESAQNVVVISSGLHGVEGFFGSAIQVTWLANLRDGIETLPDGVKVVLLHALNPYGFAWRRRVNEDNVDVNRNFLLPDEEFSGAPGELVRLNGFINPATPPPPVSDFMPKALWLILRHGQRSMQAALTQGQHTFERGLFFGGRQPVESARIVQERFDEWVGPESRVLHLDFHSGLGRFATHRLLTVVPSDSPQGSWLASRFPADRVEPIGAGVAAHTSARGTIGRWLTQRAASRGQAYAYLAPEFGTYSGVRVFAALREENRAHFFRAHPAYERTKRRLVEAFCPASERWRKTVVANGVGLIRQSIHVCQDEQWEVTA